MFAKLFRGNAIWFAVPALLVLVVFGQTLGFPLLWWDDRQHICVNPYLNSLSWQGFSKFWTEPFWGLYAPLTYSLWHLPFMAARSLWPDESNCLNFGPAFHTLSLVLHTLNSLLVFSLLRRLLKDKSDWVALTAALVFAVHPLQTETVAWVSAQRDLLCAFLGFSGLWFFMGGNPLAAGALFLLSSLAKATGVVFPLMAAALVFQEPSEKRRTLWLALAPVFLFSVGLAVLAKNLQADPLLKFESPFWQRPFVFLHNLGFYTWKFLWPWDLGPDYSRSIPALQSNIKNFAVLGFLLIPVLWIWRKPSILLAGILFLIALLPYSGFLTFGFQETSTVADRFVYIALFAVAWALGISFNDKTARYFLALLAVAAGMSLRQSLFWQDDETLFRRNLEFNPQSSVSMSNVANAVFQKDQPREAESLYLQALQMDPKNASSWLGLARSREKLNRLQEAEETYRQALSQNAASPEILNNLASMIFSLRGTDEAEIYWKQAALANPLYLEPRYNLAVFYLSRNKPHEAIARLEEALKVYPGNPLLMQKMQEAQSRLGK